MDTKVLKDKILQLAIEGKLVTQNENDYKKRKAITRDNKSRRII